MNIWGSEEVAQEFCYKAMQDVVMKDVRKEVFFFPSFHHDSGWPSYQSSSNTEAMVFVFVVGVLVIGWPVADGHFG